MPSARESLLDAAFAALARRPWSAVRMVDVAAAAGVSRQTLYNEFGSKDGLARALVRREADGYLAGVERALAGPRPPELRTADRDFPLLELPDDSPQDRLVALAEWTAAHARDNPLVRALLTGCWSERLPCPPLRAVASSSVVLAQRRADGPLPAPADFVTHVRERAATVLGDEKNTSALTQAGELAVRLALSCIAAPPDDNDVAGLLRGALPTRFDSAP